MHAAGPEDSHLQRLNPAQRRAVVWGLDGPAAAPLLISAGAGTGKTTTLAHRVAEMVLRGADPRRLLLLTFSRRAARELARRAEAAGREARLPAGSFPWSGTFHSVANRLLRRHGPALGLDAGFTILDRPDASDRHGRELVCDRPSRRRPWLVAVDDEAEQASYVADRVLETREQGVPLRRQAVLFRTAHHADLLEVELTRRNVPYVKYGGLRFLEAAHVKDLPCLLRWAENPRDEIAGFRALQLLPGVGPAIARRVLEAVVRGGTGMLSAWRPPAAARDDAPGLCRLLEGLVDGSLVALDPPSAAGDEAGPPRSTRTTWSCRRSTRPRGRSGTPSTSSTSSTAAFPRTWPPAASRRWRRSAVSCTWP